MAFTLVTGATRGIGLQLSKALAAAGQPVLVAGRDAEYVAARLNETVQLLKSAHPSSEVSSSLLDVGSADSVDNFFTKLSVPLKTVVNNAAIFERKWDEEVFDKTMRTNAFGPMRIMKQFAKIAPEGRVVNVSAGFYKLGSLSSHYRTAITNANTIEQLEAIAFQADTECGPDSAYKISKAVLNKATILFARDHPRLACSACCPGWVRSDMGGKSAPRTLEQGAASVQWLAQHANMPTGGFFRDGKPIAW